MSDALAWLLGVIITIWTGVLGYLFISLSNVLSRVAALEARSDSLDERLDRIEHKLDRILEIQREVHPNC